VKFQIKINNYKMATKIKIGADELILWLRKNNKAVGVPNDEAQGLGAKIQEIIKELDGTRLPDSEEEKWKNLFNDIENRIDKYQLPKSSAQYEMDLSNVGKLYEELNKRYT
jgi:hypothetical protein